MKADLAKCRDTSGFAPCQNCGGGGQGSVLSTCRPGYPLARSRNSEEHDVVGQYEGCGMSTPVRLKCGVVENLWEANRISPAGTL